MNARRCTAIAQIDAFCASLARQAIEGFERERYASRRTRRCAEQRVTVIAVTTTFARGRLRAWQGVALWN